MSAARADRTPLHDALLVVWFALIAADRIDIMGGSGPFILTPFLVLTPLVLISEALRASVGSRSIRWTTSANRYLATCAGLLALVFLSVLLGLDVPGGSKRAAHLLALIVGTGAVAITLVGRPGAESILVRGAKAGLGLAVAFTVWQLTHFLSGGGRSVSVGFATVNLETAAYAGWMPRLSGQVADMNRAGLLYLFYLFVLARWAAPSLRRWAWTGIALVLILLTLSRSTLLALGIVALVAWAERSETRISRPALATGAGALALVFVWMLLDPFGVESVGRTLSPLGSRFSLTEASAQSHFELLGRGVTETAESIKRAAIGIGYGNSHLVLQDIFPGNKYGNFHSLYVSFLAESGVLAFVLALILIGYPLVRGGPVRPLVAGIAAYNVFYQATAEPLLWFILAWAWLTVPNGRTLADPAPGISLVARRRLTEPKTPPIPTPDRAPR